MPEMIYHPLGKTGLEVSVLGFGGGPLGNMYGDTDQQTSTRAVHAAIDQGINFFDTSPYYGPSEMRLGEALRGKRDRVILATKGGRYGLGDFDFTAAGLRRSVEESMRRLQTDVIDLYQLHDIEFVSTSGILEIALPTLEHLRDEGKIRFIGITGYPPALLQAVAEEFPVDSILSYCHYNLLNTTLADSMIPMTRDRGIGLINASVLHMGVLTESGAPAWHPAPQEVHEAARKAAVLAHENNNDIAGLSLQFALQNPDINSTLVGMRTEEEVAANVALLQIEPDQALLEAVQEILAPVKNVTWESGMTQNHDPGAVAQRENAA